MHERELENQQSENDISVHLKKTNQRMKIIAHISNALAKVVNGVMPKW